MENTMGSWLSQSESDEGDGRNCHDGADGEVPVGTPRGDVDLTALAIERVAYWSRLVVLWGNPDSREAYH